MKSISFYDAREPIKAIEDGFVEPILNMIYFKEIMNGCELVFGSDGAFYLQSEEMTEQMGIVSDCPITITTRREVKKLGNAVAVAIGAECKTLGIQPGDMVEITIKKVNI